MPDGLEFKVGQLTGAVEALTSSLATYFEQAMTERKDVQDRLNAGDRKFDRLEFYLKLVIGLLVLNVTGGGPALMTFFSKVVFAGAP